MGKIITEYYQFEIEGKVNPSEEEIEKYWEGYLEKGEDYFEYQEWLQEIESRSFKLVSVAPHPYVKGVMIHYFRED
jgi:hypothetical protein